MNGSSGAPASPSDPATSGSPWSQDLSKLGTGLQTGAQLFNIGQGLASGTPTGEANAGLGAAALAAQHGYLGNPNTAGPGLGAASGALQLYTGLQQGGVMGDASAASGALRVGQGAASLMGDSGAASAMGDAAGAIAVPLALYNFANNWQSGNTGSDAISGAETGAAIGSAVPVVGTIAGGLIGGAVGALSSAFGGGRVDPETSSWNGLTAMQAQHPTTNLMSSLNPSQAYQSLAGMMDAKNNSPGHSTALELTFGRMGEQNLMDQMTQQINAAISGGKVPKNATAAQLYSQVVTPWLQSKNAYISPNAIISSNGTRAGNTVNNLLTQLISQWQSGALNANSRVGVAGQTISGLPAYAGG